jgi:threonine aldolase
MNRRQFLSRHAAVAALPLLAALPAAGAVTAVDDGRRVNFIHDGLALSPREYVQALQRAVDEADFGVDGYSNGGAIATLEARFAARLGKPAAVFLPSGTLANHLAVRRLAGARRRVLVQADSHLFCDSGDCAQQLSGLHLVPLAAGRVMPTLAEVQAAVEASMQGRVPAPAGVVSIETPIRRHGHAVADPEEIDAIAAYARAQGIRLHLDGARLFNLPQHTGRSVAELAAPFDTVFVSLWKHFNAAAGAILAGPSDIIDGLQHERRMFGGSLPQAWPVAALALQFLDGYEARYAEAWRRVDAIGALLDNHGFRFERDPGGSSRLFMQVPGVDRAALVAKAARAGVLLPSAPRDAGSRFTLQVNASLLRRSAEEIAAVLRAAVG